MPTWIDDSLPDNIADFRAAVFDVDGTLARDDSQISDRTIAALTRLADTGVDIIIATGRTAPAAVSILHEVGASGYAIACNGAITVHTDRDEAVSTMPIRDAVFDAAVDYCRSVDVQVAIFTPTALYCDRKAEAWHFLHGSNEGMIPHVADPTTVPPRDRLKFMIYVSHEQDETVGPELRTRFPEVMKTLPEYYEINEPGVDKWVGVKAALEDLRIDPGEALGMGDSENDLSWLPRIGMPIAMGNAFDSVVAECSYQIGSSEDDRAAAFIERWAEFRISSGLIEPIDNIA
ncbi:HAD family hydrolase [Flaviflexus huanghaiensis]|uniref:HAD family hydrolase n=1 Tax=Flaviflexus huanghaiensis TaxID=1111473 RepID=UPI0015FD99B5|nr:HAD family hydrolase [Flaviflexus huanghaiensis]